MFKDDQPGRRSELKTTSSIDFTAIHPLEGPNEADSRRQTQPFPP
jgi:hypothetical protein